MRDAALHLLGACLGVDILNENMLQYRLGSYRALVVRNQRIVSPDTFQQIECLPEVGGYC